MVERGREREGDEEVSGKHKHSSISFHFVARRNFIRSPPKNCQLVEEYFCYIHPRVD